MIGRPPGHMLTIWALDDTPRRRSPWGDAPPDKGCQYAPRCLDCPLPVCRYDGPPAR